ncbi:purine and uridine phosphorylase [Hypoxylon argillaceum]|nr:purine and uridine phosphorylase [Hypoxylon argillaceum]
MSELDPALYTVIWFALLDTDARAALHVMDNVHEGRFPMSRGHDYVFIAGDVLGHNIVLATLPAGQEYGTGSAAALASQAKAFFPNLWFGLLVGVAAGIPNLSRRPARDIRLGDILVALPDGETAGLVAYDLGKETAHDGFQPLRRGYALASAEPVIGSAISSIRLRAGNNAQLFLQYYEAMKHEKYDRGTFLDPGQDKDLLYEMAEDGAEKLVDRQPRQVANRTRVWYGPIGSGEKLMKNARRRDELRDKHNIIGLEMAAGGIVNRIPVGVVCGVSNYGDAHKNKEWQAYASAMAAAYAKAVLNEIRRPPVVNPPKQSTKTGDPRSVLDGPRGKLLFQVE